MKKVLVLGVSGSIGYSTLNVIRKHRDLFSLCGASAHKNKAFLESIRLEFNIKALALTGSQQNEDSFYSGPNAIEALINASKPDIIVNGIAGSAGLAPSMLALKSGIDLALANKETIVMAGSLIKKTAIKHGASILPVDSEHAALFELSKNQKSTEIKNLWLTASGGPFRTRELKSFPQITLEETLAHPTWKMGHKISVDSATMANKGLELIEAVHLFDMSPDKIKVVIHPTSQVHSLIETIEGSFYAQLSNPNMQLPILNALSWPLKVKSDIGQLDIFNLQLNFSKPEEQRYPMLNIAYQAAKRALSAPLVYNAANEAAVEAFLNKQISYLQIPKIVETILNRSEDCNLCSLKEILELNELTYKQTEQLIMEMK